MDTRTPLKVLFVEDDNLQRRAFSEFLGMLPSFEVYIIEAVTLAEAIKYLQVIKFDLIILDLGLPDSSGVETIQEIQKATDTKILILTGGEMDDETLENHDIRGYLRKTELTGDLKESIKKLDTEIQISLETASFRKKRERLERVTSNLQKQVSDTE